MTNEVSALLLDFARKDPIAFATSIEDFSIEDVEETLGRLPDKLAASVIAGLSAAKIKELLTEVDEKRLNWLAGGSLEDVKVILVRLPEGRRKSLVRKLKDGPHKITLLRFLSYPKHSLGRYVSNEVILVQAAMPTAEVISLIRDSKPGLPVVVVNKNGKYAGILDARRVLEGKADESIGKFINKVAPLRAEAALVDTMEVEDWQRHSVLAAVDYDDHVLGVISREDLLRNLAIAPASRKPLDSALDIFQLYVKALTSLVNSVFQIRSKS